MYNAKIGKFKASIVGFLNNSVENDEERVDTLDVFMYDGNRSLRLTHYGFRNLKDHYEFFELEFDFELNVVHAAALDKLMNAPYYYKFESRDGLCYLKTADKRFMKKLKIAQYNLLNLLD